MIQTVLIGAALLVSAGAGANSAIIGGITVSEEDPIAQSTVGILNSDGSICSGSLIAENLVVTAAHCLKKNRSTQISFGVVMYHIGGVKRRVRSYEIHPEYISMGRIERNRRKCRKECGNDADCRTRCQAYVNMNDLAILAFIGQLPRGFRPADIAWDVERLFNVSELQVAGYGKSSRFDRQQGDHRLLKATLPLKSFGPEILLMQSGSPAVCAGDSGGPALLNEQGRTWLVGTASRVGEGCREFAIYGRLGAHRDWIEEAMKRLSGQESSQ